MLIFSSSSRVVEQILNATSLAISASDEAQNNNKYGVVALLVAFSALILYTFKSWQQAQPIKDMGMDEENQITHSALNRSLMRI